MPLSSPAGNSCQSTLWKTIELRAQGKDRASGGGRPGGFWGGKPTHWLEKGQDFENRDVSGMEDFSWDSKGFCGSWWPEGMPPSGSVSHGWSALEDSARRADVQNHWHFKLGKMERSNWPAPPCYRWENRDLRWDRGTCAARVIRAAQGRDPYRPGSSHSTGMSS